MATSTSTSHLQCLCGAVTEPGTLLASPTFPIETELCHCNVCRRCSGALGGTFAELSGPPSEKSLAACTRYSREGGVVHRYHCSTCGSRVFDHSEHISKWFACAGIIEQETVRDGVDHGVSGDVVKITSHCYVGDTGDGGLARFMGRLGVREIPSFVEGFGPGISEMSKEELDATFRSKGSMGTVPPSDRLTVSCHCGQIQFHILRPSQQTEGTPAVSRWLSADGTKYLGLNCACRYDRLSLGFSVVPWIYVMPENIVAATTDGTISTLFQYSSGDKEMPQLASTTTSLQRALPGLKCYFSSFDCRRCFCGKCGANVFFEDEIRPAAVNVAAGLLRSDMGCLAADWVEWDWQRIPWEEQTVDREVVEAIRAAPEPSSSHRA